MSSQRFNELVEAYIFSRLDQAGAKELLSMLENPANKAALEELIDGQLETRFYDQEDIDLQTTHQRIIKKLEAAIKPEQTIPLYRRKWLRYAAAAVFIAAVALAGELWIREKRVTPALAKVDVKAPATNRAMITLANGKTVYLDSASNGQLAMQDGVQLTKQADGSLSYSGASLNNSKELQYNTLTNPKGSLSINVVLPDGSQIWLNAGSSVTYPIAFITPERHITMNGELYYEVAHDSKKPFIVQKGQLSVTVYGTHFNVKAYDNDADMKVTLLEGSVAVNDNSKRQLLKPGQQAVVKADNIELLENADTDQAIAWKNGTTSFHSADIQAVLKELERWYNITMEVKVELKIKSFFMEAPRTAPLQDVLKSIFDDNNIAYEYDSQNRKLTILKQ